MRINNHTVEASSNVGMKVNASRAKSSGRVNINNLMSKVRADYKKQKNKSSKSKNVIQKTDSKVIDINKNKKKFLLKYQKIDFFRYDNKLQKKFIALRAQI